MLAIGDRHLENILVRPDGRLFHIDFGWLFGRDPKPRPALLKLSPEIVSAIRGVETANFSRFINYIVSCFLGLRKSANMTLALLKMLRGSGIVVVEEDDPTNFAWLQERLLKNVSDDEAASAMVQLVGK